MLAARSIALLLGQQSSLKRLDFRHTNLGDGELVEIASALKKQPQLVELNLGYNNIGRDGCVSLGCVLEGLGCPNLSILKLDGNNIDDEGLSALVEGLKKNCHNLTSLSLRGNELITESGLRSLSTLFQSDHCRLERLDLCGLNIDDDGAAGLATGLASSMRLKRLYLSDNRIGDRGLQELSGALVNCNLEEFRLAFNMLSSSALGLRSLGTLVQRVTGLKTLSLWGSGIDDSGLQYLVEGMGTVAV